jgi:2-dehydropantoate 2-reductase
VTKIAIVGSGGVGGYFGARLARAGINTSFVARGAHLEAIRKRGLCIDGPNESFVARVPATDDSRDIGHVDFILFAVKLWDTRAAAITCEALQGPDTAILTLQNGIESAEMLSAIVPRPSILAGVAEISAAIEEPGTIRKVSPFHRIRLGELDSRRTERVDRLARILSEAGVEVDVPADTNLAVWSKFIFLTGLSALTALTRRPIGEVRSDPDTRRLLTQVMEEAADVGRADGTDIPTNLVADHLALVDGLNPEIRASMAVDLEFGRRLELPWLSGAVVRKGAALGVPTPANEFVSAALKLHL